MFANKLDNKSTHEYTKYINVNIRMCKQDIDKTTKRIMNNTENIHNNINQESHITYCIRSKIITTQTEYPKIRSTIASNEFILF